MRSQRYRYGRVRTCTALLIYSTGTCGTKLRRKGSTFPTTYGMYSCVDGEPSLRNSKHNEVGFHFQIWMWRLDYVLVPTPACRVNSMTQTNCCTRSKSGLVKSHAVLEAGHLVKIGGSMHDEQLICNSTFQCEDLTMNFHRYNLPSMLATVA